MLIEDYCNWFHSYHCHCHCHWSRVLLRGILILIIWSWFICQFRKCRNYDDAVYDDQRNPYILVLICLLIYLPDASSIYIIYFVSVLADHNVLLQSSSISSISVSAVPTTTSSDSVAAAPRYRYSLSSGHCVIVVVVSLMRLSFEYRRIVFNFIQ